MYNLRANRDVPDDSWWDNGGNVLWKQYATVENVDRQTNTLFLEDDQMAAFLRSARTIPGWVEDDAPLPFDCPLWYIRQNIRVYLCIDWRLWRRHLAPPFRKMVRELLETGESRREQIRQAFRRAVDRVLEDEKSRWLVFGVTHKFTKRMRGNQLTLSEWQGAYGRQYRLGMSQICRKVDSDLLEEIPSAFGEEIQTLYGTITGRDARQ